MSSDQIAYLRDLANSYFQEGNLTAAISTWEQVLSMDPSNIEARQGITLAQMKQQGVSQDAGSGPDPDATMMFQAGEGGFGLPPAPAPGGGAFDADRTMVFGGPAAPAPPGGAFDAERTMMFGGSPAPPAPGQGGGFDAERTMIFGGAPAAPAAPPAPAPSGGFDAERTMVFSQGMTPGVSPPPASPPTGGFDADRTMAFNPSLVPPPAAAPPPAAPAWTPPAAPGSTDWLKPATPAQDADSTMMSPPTAADFGFPATVPAPSPFLPPPPPGGAGTGRALEDFSLPAAPPAFTPPPGLGGAGLPPPPGGSTGGFSFELPPPPSKGGAGLPDLPSVGFSSPPPAFTPAPPLPTTTTGPQKKAGGQFGEVDPGEIESLQVPTIAPTAPPPDESSRKEREDEMKRQYEQQYGRSTGPASTPPPPRVAPSRPAVSPKVLVTIGIILAVVLGGGYAGITWWTSRQPDNVLPQPEKDPNLGLSKDQAESQINAKVLESDKARREGRLADAERFLKEGREIALKNNIPIPVPLLTGATELEREKAYQDALAKAVRSFCLEDYPKANYAFQEIEKQRPDKSDAGKYIERIFWNLGIEKLQQMEPWEATYYLEGLAQRNPADKEAVAMLEYARQFQPGAQLGDAYLSKVDPLSTRMAGCR